MESQEAKGRGLHCVALSVLTGALSLVFSAGVRAEATGAESAESAMTYRFVKGRLLVQPRPGLPDKELDKILKPHGGKRVGHLKEIDVHIVELPAQANEMALAKLLKKNPHLKFAELDEVLAPDATPNDPYFPNAWHLSKVSAPAAWDLAGGAGIVVAVLDTGVNVTHPDLLAKMVSGWNVRNNSSDITDVYGHGTKVAGVLAAATGNSVGVSGLAWYSKIMPVRIDDGTGYATYSSMAAGITWAADHGAKVANVSYMGPAASSTVQSAAQYMRSRGGVVVCSAGNNNTDYGYLASSAVTVAAATASDDSKASWSNFGQYVDVSAPGIGVWTTTASGGYGTVSGTSFSSPITAGVYALMMTANPALSPASLDKVLFSTARDLGAVGWDPVFGHGRVDARAAVERARLTVESDSTAPAVAISSPTGGTVSGLVSVNVSASDSGGVARVDLYIGSTKLASDFSAPFGFSWDTAVFADGAKSLTAKAYDAAGNVGTSPGVSVTVANDAIAPKVTLSNPVSGSTVSGSVNVSASATDNKAVGKMSLFVNGNEVMVSHGSSLSYVWSAPPARGNKTSATLVVKAYDPAGNVGQASATVKLK